MKIKQQQLRDNKYNNYKQERTKSTLTYGGANDERYHLTSMTPFFTSSWASVVREKSVSNSQTDTGLTLNQYQGKLEKSFQKNFIHFLSQHNIFHLLYHCLIHFTFNLNLVPHMSFTLFICIHLLSCDLYLLIWTICFDFFLLFNIWSSFYLV